MRFLFGTIFVLALVAVGTYTFGYWSPNHVSANSWRAGTPPRTSPITTSAPSGRVAQLGAQAEKAATTVGEFISDAELSAKIKSKMALDDSVRARRIDVSTTDGVVTLAGTVGSAAERVQAVRLARDTKGITQVVDHLKVLVN
jgi:hyperosmotically inducible protein